MPSVSGPDPIVTDLLNGDATAWGRLYVAHRDAMYGAAMKVLRNVDDARDAVQEAISSAMTAGADNLRNTRNLANYLAGVAHHKAVDIIRSRNRTVTTDPEVLGSLGDDEVMDVEHAATDNLAVDTGIALLNDMPEKVRYAYRERVLKARKAKEVAAELDVDPSYIANLVHQATTFIQERSPFLERTDIDSPDRRIAAKDPA